MSADVIARRQLGDASGDYVFSWFDGARGDQAASQALILAGLSEHWGAAMDASLNGDVFDLSAAFALDSEAETRGWLLTAHHDGKLVGVAGLRAAGERVFELRRMSVAAGHRRRGVAAALLDLLEQHARACRASAVYLETTESWQDVVRLYTRAGYTPVLRLDGDLYFVKRLDGRTDDLLAVLPARIVDQASSTAVNNF